MSLSIRSIGRALCHRNFLAARSQNLVGWRLTSTRYISPSFEEVFRAKLSRWIAWYDEITGLEKVLWAQNRVIELEQQVLLSQSERREVSRSLDVLRTKIRELNTELENTTRGDDKYVQIITQEHRLLKEEKVLSEKLKFVENGERDLFSALSTAVRESHENERARAERTKYWSIIGTLIGSVLGVLGSTWNNRVKLRELKRMVEDTAQLRDGVKQDVHGILLEFVQQEEKSPVSKQEEKLAVSKQEEKSPVSKQEEPVMCFTIPNLEREKLEYIISKEAFVTRTVMMTGLIITALFYTFFK